MTFVVNDFTVRYVVDNSNSALPGVSGRRNLGGVRGLAAAEGLDLRGCVVQALDAVARLLAVMGAITFGFLLFILFTSNPFSRTLPLYPVDGLDLNPQLQDTIRRSSTWATWASRWTLLSPLPRTSPGGWSRPWIQAAWVLLTLGIVLGSLWAYWGSWWFWDPVENA